MNYKYFNSFLGGVKHGNSVSYQTYSVLTYQFFSNQFDEAFNIFDEISNDCDSIFSPSIDSCLELLTY